MERRDLMRGSILAGGALLSRNAPPAAPWKTATGLDARLFPEGWLTPSFTPGEDWPPAMVLRCRSNKPPLYLDYEEYLLNTFSAPEGCELRALVECPPEMGFSCAANADWRLRALGKRGAARNRCEGRTQRFRLSQSRITVVPLKFT